MSKSLSNDDDIRRSQEMTESKGGAKYLKFPNEQTPFFIPDKAYADGYVHWVTLPNGSKHKIVCEGGEAGGGRAPDACPICKKALELFVEAKRLRENPRASKDDTLRAAVLKDQGNAIAGRYENRMIMIQGITLTVRSKNSKAGKSAYDYEAEFPTEGESVAKVGVMNLSESQYKGLTGLVRSPDFPFMKAGSDLQNRVIWSYRGKNDKGSQKVFFRPEAKTRPIPVELGQEWDDLDLSKDFEIKPGEAAKVIALLEGRVVEDMPGDDAVGREESGPATGNTDGPWEDSAGPDLGDVGDDFLDDDPMESLAPNKKGGSTMAKSSGAGTKKPGTKKPAPKKGK
jgi:hypothetical protein